MARAAAGFGYNPGRDAAIIPPPPPHPTPHTQTAIEKTPLVFSVLARVFLSHVSVAVA